MSQQAVTSLCHVSFRKERHVFCYMTGKTKNPHFPEQKEKTMKKLSIICFALLLVVALALSAAACDGVKVTADPENGTVTITPTDGGQSGSQQGESDTVTIREIMNSNPTNFNKFVQSVSNKIEDIYDSENNGNIIYMACDVNDKDKETIDDLTFYTAVKGSGDNRTIMYQTCTFASIKAKDIADDNFELTDLIIESTDKARYDAYEKQNDDAFLNAHFGEEHDFVLKAYEKEHIEHEVTPPHQAVITDVNTLIADYPTQTKNLGDKIAKAILKKYDIENPLYCGYSFFDEDENAQVNEMTVSVATKVDETERKFATYKVTFDPVYLDKIADGTYALTSTKSAFLNQQTYDAKEKQNDADFLAALYEQNDFVYVAYVAETFDEQGGESGDPEEELTIERLIAEHGAEINANLATHYDNVLKERFGRSYNTQKNYVTNYQWDLGEINENNEIQNSKLTFLHERDNTSSLNVYNVNFNNPVNINDLKNSNISNVSASYSQEYLFSYNNTLQGTRSDLVSAILNKAITDDFDYQNAEIMFKDNGSSTNAEFGSIRNFTIIVKNSKGIREIATAIQSADSDAELVAKLQQGKGSINFSDQITYSTNQLPAVDPNAPAQGSVIQTLIAEHGAEINANLATQYDNVLKRAFKTNYNSYKDKVTNYQWDLGEINENNEIQNTKLTFNYQNGTSAGLYVYDVNFNNPVNINDLKNSIISNVAATYSQEYVFSYNNSIQGTRTELVNAILSKAITDDFDYQNAEIIFKDNGSSTTSDLGTVRKFSVTIKNNDGITVVATTIQSANSDEELINKINNGKYSLNVSTPVTYSQNLLAEYNASEAEMN